MTIFKVEQLAQVADDESGSYCVALVIRDNGKENYIMRRSYYQLRSFVFDKISFPNREGLMEAFPGTYRKKGWERTTVQCGFQNISESDFWEADKRARNKFL